MSTPRQVLKDDRCGTDVRKAAKRRQCRFAMASSYQRPVLCRLCRFPVPDGGVLVSQLDRQGLSEWCLRMMDTELDQEGLEKAIFCKFCICDASFEEENSHLASNGCWKTFSSDAGCLEKYYSDGLIKPCAVQMTILSKEQIKALTYKKPNCRKGEYFCVYCGQRLEAKQHMIQHVKKVHSNIKTFYCFECQTFFKSLLNQKQHQVTHHRQCNFCSEVLESRVKYRAHVKKVHKAYVFQCSYNTNCAAFFKSEEERREHVEKVHETGKWKKKRCIYCKKVVTALGVHIKKYHSDVAIPCNYDKLCNDHFLTQENRLKHILEKHEAEKKSKSHLRCFFCNKMTMKCNYPKHMRKYHPSEVVIKCNFHQKCATYFLTEEQRQKHILEKHESGDDKVKCVYCKKMIIQAYLNDHVKVYHKTETIIKCDFFKNCRAYFLTQEEKEGHVKQVHLTKKMREQAKCIYCGKILVDKVTLVTHVNLVHPDVKIKCPFHKCQEFFHKESERDEHFQQFHQKKEDAKIYKCIFCDFKSDNKRSLRFHVSSKHGTQNIKCPQCEKMYKSDYALWSHIRTTHKPSKRCKFCNRNTVAMHSHALRSVCKFCKKEVACKGLSAKHLRECKPKPKCATCCITFKNHYGRTYHLKTKAHKLKAASKE